MTSYVGPDANPYRPSSRGLNTQTPSLDEVIGLATRSSALDLRVCLPCKIEQVVGQQNVDVKPLLQQRTINGLIDYPVIPGCLVSMPVGADFSIVLPLAKGDTGLVVFCDRSLDAYMASDGATLVDPANDRCHNLTDAIFIPGLVPNPKQTSEGTDLVIRNGKASMRVEKSGMFKFTNGKNELVDLNIQLTKALMALINDLQGALVMTPMGPSPFLASTLSQFASTLATAQQITTNLQTLKG